jgi:hypothetical protein
LREQWYGDNRDLVKWGVLLHLAHMYSAIRIIQVAYLRPTNWGSLEIDGKEYPIPDPVIEHFRSVPSVTRLAVGVSIHVVQAAFTDRTAYMYEILNALAAAASEPSIVFLDPDTGLAPQTPDLKHVLDKELKDIWRGIKKDDVLVLYQHQTNRSGAPWIPSKKLQFETALEVPPGAAKVAHGPKVAREVAFFYLPKTQG